jgi:hypothetical protein
MTERGRCCGDERFATGSLAIPLQWGDRLADQGHVVAVEVGDDPVEVVGDERAADAAGVALVDAVPGAEHEVIDEQLRATSNKSASVFLPSSVSTLYSFSTGTQGSSLRRRASSSPWRMCSFSASSSSLQPDSHSSRATTACLGMGLLLRRRR